MRLVKGLRYNLVVKKKENLERFKKKEEYIYIKKRVLKREYSEYKQVGFRWYYNLAVKK